MLAVDIDQLNAKLFQNGNRHRYAINLANVLAVKINLTLNDRFRLIRHIILCKPGRLRRVLEDGAYQGLQR